MNLSYDCWLSALKSAAESDAHARGWRLRDLKTTTFAREDGDPDECDGCQLVLSRLQSKGRDAMGWAGVGVENREPGSYILVHFHISLSQNTHKYICIPDSMHPCRDVALCM